jgi:WD40 repeat protein
MPASLSYSWSADSKFLATVDGSLSLVLWDVAADREVCRITKVPREDGGGFPNSLRLSPDGTRLAVSGAVLTRAVHIYRVEPGVQEAKERLMRDIPGSVGSWSPDSRKLAIVKDAILQVGTPEDWKPIGARLGYRAGFWGVRWSPDGKRLATSGGEFEVRNFAVRLWDSGGLKPLWQAQMTVRPDEATQLDWFPNNRAILSSSFDRVVVLDAETGKTTATVLGLPKDSGLIVNREGHIQVSGSALESVVYVAYPKQAAQEVLTLDEFARLYHWTNDPARLRIGK